MNSLRICAALLASLPLLASPAPAQAQERPAPWHPKLLFGTVNFNEQLADDPAAWRNTAARVDGMLLHIHFWVRHMRTPGNDKVADAEVIERKIAPALRGKANVVELTYDIRDAQSSPEAIGRDHAQQVATLEKEIGVPISAVNVDWILGGFDAQRREMPRTTGETDAAYDERVLRGVLDKSARYVAAFRAAGRTEKLIAVFPPLYLDEGRWTNVRKSPHPGITASKVLKGLFAVGFDGFTADSPFFLLSNPAYRAAGYYDALHSLQATCRQNGKPFGFILNGDNKEDGAAYDALYEKNCLQALALICDDGLRPDALVLESWYRGPFRLTPETQPGTLTHTVLQVAEKLKETPKP